MPASGDTEMLAIRGSDLRISRARWKSTVQSSSWQCRNTRIIRTGSDSNTFGASAASSRPRTMNPSTRLALRRRAIFRVSRIETLAPLDFLPIVTASRLSIVVEIRWIVCAER